jgi:hypothetical protein
MRFDQFTHVFGTGMGIIIRTELDVPDRVVVASWFAAKWFAAWIVVYVSFLSHNGDKFLR